MSKYKSKKVVIDGLRFDSQKEANRYCELKMLERTGAISDLKTQVVFNLIPKQVDENGKPIERRCDYKADFVYTENGKTVVEDVKGYKDGSAYQLYVIKRKLMLLIYKIHIREI